MTNRVYAQQVRARSKIYKLKGIKVLGLTGGNGGKMASEVDYVIKGPQKQKST